MKVNIEARSQKPEARSLGGRAKLLLRRRRGSAALPASGFTMVEIAICLAIIGIALISIIGVLPIGMNTQRDNREETIINQDATILMEAIRGGAKGLDDLTNYVYSITNSVGNFNSVGVLVSSNNVGFTYNSGPILLTNGANIIGVLSAPEFIDSIGNPTNNVWSGGYSNHIVAYVRSISGPAIEKPLQDNDIVREGSFGYRLLCVNAPVAADPTSVTNWNGVVTNEYFQQLNANLHELRLAFFWPQQPNGSLGPGRQSFRTLVAGQIVTNMVSGAAPGNAQTLYFYASQSFINVTNAP